ISAASVRARERAHASCSLNSSATTRATSIRSTGRRSGGAVVVVSGTVGLRKVKALARGVGAVVAAGLVGEPGGQVAAHLPVSALARLLRAGVDADLGAALPEDAHRALYGLLGADEADLRPLGSASHGPPPLVRPAPTRGRQAGTAASARPLPGCSCRRRAPPHARPRTPDRPSRHGCHPTSCGTAGLPSGRVTGSGWRPRTARRATGGCAPPPERARGRAEPFGAHGQSRAGAPLRPARAGGARTCGRCPARCRPGGRPSLSTRPARGGTHSPR